jgi:glycosyltransferase involved in cell wall biosynthesis
MVADQLDSPWKGVRETLSFLDALELRNTQLLLVGRGDVVTQGRTIPTHSLGYLQDPLALALAYNAADVLLCPSTHEAFGKVLVEAAACGTPAIALRDTGAGEVNSTLGNAVIERMDLDSLGAALLPILSHPLGEASRRELRARGENHYGAERVATQYLDLYQHMAGY